jgi:hypothetical protein
MARPIKNDIDSGIQNWDGKIDDNDEALFNAPLPVHEHTGDETDIASTFSAAAYDRCVVWVDHTVLGWVLMYSDGSNWLVLPQPHATDSFSVTTSQTASHDFVVFTGTGTVDYDLLAAANWPGRIVFVRNDKTSGTLNIDPNGSEVINDETGGTAIAPAIGQTVMLISTGTKVFASIQADI